MPVLAAIELCFQAFFLIHAFRSGSDRYWIYIILFFPGIGCLVYFFVEYIPSLQRDYRMQKFKNNVSSALNPGKHLRLLQMEVERTPSVKNKKALADAYVNAGLFDPAIELYFQCMQGTYADDPHLMEGLSCAHFFKGDYVNAKKYLNLLLAGNDDYKADQFRLLLARSHEALGEDITAMEIYARILPTISGEEARCRYALLLKKKGRIEQAGKLFNDILTNARLSPRYYKKTQRQWIETAGKEVAP